MTYDTLTLFAVDFIVQNLLFDWKQMKPEAYKLIKEDHYFGRTFGFGIDGFRDKSQESGQEVFFYPAVPTKSKFSESFKNSKLPADLQEFFDRHESIVFISFGTMFMPPKDQMMRIYEAIKISDPKVGYILSLKDYADSYGEMKQAESELTNFLVKTWVPQTELLANKKTKLFLTHCGANGAIEAMYYGVAMLGFPQMEE